MSIIKKARIANEATALVNQKEDIILLERKKRLEKIKETFQNGAQSRREKLKDCSLGKQLC